MLGPTKEIPFNMDDDPESLALNFPPTEIFRKPTDRYVESDPFTMSTFLYPCNVTRREYQFDICQVCFRYNTLVCLPTGSGKTFIAAVVIWNFHRWYPKGKILFLAPTRNLVYQQIDAVKSFTEIPEEDIVVITGSADSSNFRDSVYNDKSIFFCTPQCAQNDINKKRLDPSQIILMIMDEAHHARGNYAYTQIVRQIASRSSQFRVIGLSATPANDFEGIQHVIFNLMISKIEYKDEDDEEISKYQQNVVQEILTVQLGADESALSTLLGNLITALAQKLQYKSILSNSMPQALTHGAVFLAMKRFRENPNGEKRDFYNSMDQLSLLMKLSIMYEKLSKYGTHLLNNELKKFEAKSKDTENKRQIINSSDFLNLKRLSEKAKNSTHPKLAKLSIILEEFFSSHFDSRVIVYTQFREVAKNISTHLKKVKGVKPSLFVGKINTSVQGQDDSIQKEIVSMFRKGNINTIVATSVAEEGLDIGEVDLIICYDTSSSALKNIQRIGRTGRKRDGHVIYLMTEGVEERHLQNAQNKKKYLKKKMTTEINHFVLYDPERPNLPLPERLEIVNRKSVHNVKKPNKFEFYAEIRSPYLKPAELHHLQSTHGDNLIYPKLHLRPQKQHVSIIISSSNESNLLFNLRKKTDDFDSVPSDLEDDTSAALALIISMSQKPSPKTPKASYTQVKMIHSTSYIDDDFEDIDIDEPPPKSKPKSDNPFACDDSDSDDDSDIELKQIKQRSQPKSATNNTSSKAESYLDDDSADFDDFESAESHNSNSQSEPSCLTTNDINDLVRVTNSYQKLSSSSKSASYLDDSDLDDVDLDMLGI